MTNYAGKLQTGKKEKIWGGCPGALHLVQQMQSQGQAKNGEDLGRMPRYCAFARINGRIMMM